MANKDYKLEDLIDISLLQDLQEKLNEVYSFPSAIIDNEGKILTAVAWQDICIKFHRKHPLCEKECIKSDQYILEHLHEANPAVSYQCPHGLIDNATPIIIDGRHMGNFFTGQFFLEKPDLDFFRKQAQKYNFNEKEYLEAVSKVPIWTKQKVTVYLNFIKGFIQIIAGIGLKNLYEKETNLKLIQQEDRYRTILKTASDGFWLVNRQGQLLEVNNAYCVMSGYSESELLNMNIADFDIYETPDLIDKHFDKILKIGEDRFLTKHRRKDGTIFDVEISVQYLQNSNELFVTFIRDVSDRIKTEMELVRAKEEAEEIKDRFDYATSIGKVGTWDWNLLTNDLTWSTETYRILGFEPFSIIPNYELFLNMVHPDDREKIDSNVKLAWEGKKPYSVDCRIIRTNSEERMCNATGKVEYDRNDKPIRMLGTFQDITERKKIENELIIANEKTRISEEKYRALYDNAPLSYQSLNENGHFLDVNPMWLKTLGYERDEVIGKWYGDFLHPDYVEHFRVNFPVFKKNGYISDVQFKLKKKDGSFVHVSFEGCVGYTPEGKFRQTYCVFKDITEQKALEQYLIKAKEVAEENEKKIKLQNDEITYNNERLESLLRISQISTNSNQELLDCTLQEAVTLTKSKIGYIYFYNPEKRQFTLNTWSRDVMKECTILNPQTIYDLDKTGCWGEAVRQRKPIIINDYEAEKSFKKGIPDGHIKLYKFLTIPVFSQGEIVAVAGVANKETDYDNSDIRQLTLLMDNVWKISERILLINDLKLAKEKVEESELKYRTIFEGAPIGIFRSTKDGKFIEVNQALATMLGYETPEEVLNSITNISDQIYVYSEKRDTIVNEINKSEIHKYENIYKRKNGEHFYANLYLKEIIDEKGNNILEGMVEETTAIKEKETELIVAKDRAEKSEQNYKLIFNSTGTSNSIFNKDLLLINQNQQSRNSLGKDGIGQNVYELFGENAGRLIHERMKRVFKTGVSEVFETEFNLPGGKNWFRSTYQPMIDENKNITAIQVISQNITEFKNAELELIAAKEKAEESDRLKTAFLQNMSHEIRTPMNAIMGFSELLMNNFNNQSKLAHFTNIINQRCNDLLVIIDDILDISKIESGQLPVTIEPCNLNSLFSEIRLFFEEHQQKIGKQHIKFIFQAQCNPSRRVITTDKVKLKQIFINLIGNAFKFTDSGQIEGGCSINEPNNIMFYVSDTGIGIPAEKQEVIFERFVQLEPTPNRLYGGTGLGLSIVKGLVTLLKGKIWLESKPGIGSTFYFSLPCIIQDENTIDSFSDESEHAENNYENKTILIVEDDNYNAAFIKEVLSEILVNTIFVQYGKEAIDIALSQAIDIVLMDIGLPDISGYEATRLIIQHKPHIKIIAQTAFATSEDKRKAIEAGCIDYISKPLKSKMLISILKKHLS